MHDEPWFGIIIASVSWPTPVEAEKNMVNDYDKSINHDWKVKRLNPKLF